MKAKEAKAKELLAKLKNDVKQFAQIAKDNSDDTASAAQGGDLGFFAKHEMVPEFSKAAFATKPNTLYSEPVKTEYGYHIIFVTDRAEAATEPFDKVKDDIKGYLVNKRQIELIDNLIESLKKNAEIKYLNPEYNPDNIQKEVQKTIKEQEEKDKKSIEKKAD